MCRDELVWRARDDHTYILNPDVSIPDENSAGLMESFSLNGLTGSITNVQVSLDIMGGFNGDLYAYLAGPQGQFAVLLNRAGLSGSKPFGFGARMLFSP
jgi:subtilisin-like proprotein convertase family protein